MTQSIMVLHYARSLALAEDRYHWTLDRVRELLPFRNAPLLCVLADEADDPLADAICEMAEARALPVAFWYPDGTKVNHTFKREPVAARWLPEEHVYDDDHNRAARLAAVARTMRDLRVDHREIDLVCLRDPDSQEIYSDLATRLWTAAAAGGGFTLTFPQTLADIGCSR